MSERKHEKVAADQFAFEMSVRVTGASHAIGNFQLAIDDHKLMSVTSMMEVTEDGAVFPVGIHSTLAPKVAEAALREIAARFVGLRIVEIGPPFPC